MSGKFDSYSSSNKIYQEKGKVYSDLNFMIFC